MVLGALLPREHIPMQHTRFTAYSCLVLTRTFFIGSCISLSFSRHWMLFGPQILYISSVWFHCEIERSTSLFDVMCNIDCSFPCVCKVHFCCRSLFLSASLASLIPPWRLFIGRCYTGPKSPSIWSAIKSWFLKPLNMELTSYSDVSFTMRFAMPHRFRT